MKLILFWKPFLWFIIICLLSLMPGNKIPHTPIFTIPHFDKLVHLSFYFILCLFLFRPLKNITSKYYIIALFTSVLLSGLIEVLQNKIAISRHGDVYDLLANITGAVLAFAILQILYFRENILNGFSKA